MFPLKRQRESLSSLKKTLFLSRETNAFLSGIMRILDIGGTQTEFLDPDHFFPSPQSDYEALKSDWETIGLDLQTAIHEYPSQEK